MDLQTCVALTFVGLCAAYVIRQWFRTLTGRSTGACHSAGCDGCAKMKACNDAPQSNPSAARDH